MSHGSARSTRHPVVVDAAIVAVLVAAGAAFYLTRFGDLFPLIEYRQWLEFPLQGPGDLLEAMLTDSAFPRSVPLWYATASGDACGVDVACLNVLAFLPLAAAGGALYVFVRLLGAARAVSALVVAAWWLSVPVAEAVSWQATLLDRLATAFALVALCVAVAVLRRPRCTAALVGGSVALLALTLLAYSSKEAAFCLAPSLLLFAVLGARAWDVREIGRRLAFVAAPVALAIVHNLRYLTNPDAGTGGEHTVGGSPVTNAKRFATYLLDSLTVSSRTLWPWVVLGLVVAAYLAWSMLAASRRSGWAKRFDALHPARIALWLWLTAAIALLIPLRTQYGSPFYLVLPAALTYAATAWTLQQAVAMLADVRVRWVVGSALAIVVAFALAINFSTSFPTYRAVATRSDAFQAGLAEVRRLVPARGAGPIYLVTDDSAYYAYRFVTGPGSRDLYQWIYRDPDPSPAFERRLRDLPASQFAALGRREPGATYVVFDAEMRLIRVDRGDRMIYDAGA